MHPPLSRPDPEPGTAGRLSILKRGAPCRAKARCINAGQLAPDATLESWSRTLKICPKKTRAADVSVYQRTLGPYSNDDGGKSDQRRQGITVKCCGAADPANAALNRSVGALGRGASDHSEGLMPCGTKVVQGNVKQITGALWWSAPRVGVLPIKLKA